MELDQSAGRLTAVHAATCPACLAPPGQLCVNQRGGVRERTHAGRLVALVG